MKFHPNILPSLAWFYCVAQHRSFTKAALEMDVSRPALSQHVKTLEQHFGIRLFQRTTRSMSLTEEGQSLYEVLKVAFGQIEQGLSTLQDAPNEPSGLIRINSSRVAARLLLEPHLAAFLAAYPKIQVELQLNDGMSNIIAEGIDIGIRLGQSLDEHMVAIPLTTMLETAIVASPHYLQKHGIPQHPKELIQHNCLSYRYTSSSGIDQWKFHTVNNEQHPIIFEPKGNLIFNDDQSMITAALEGIGMIRHFNLCMQPYINEGKLVRVLQDWCQPFTGFYLYVPSRNQMPAKIRVLIDFLVAQRETFQKTI
ncbi:LysR family transcriptional regulator [Acinetobacter baumannii]|uniref:LysR family transcriptional regulator n=1 Tax=Acinetobacter baumannii TaxID=470 RepID=UPI002447051A|nr:LysR family transcriptional regulator [Acinetobacter baumannii]MDH2549377.1 LysR family transcriptional regulator [Acinetobacter baumannii]MDO7475222.1 LysR family transcriptional regulator [Acinetobacter baumannii]MDO7505439.1 LysR family transcriptional regulator [Acinetobacter baumannii]MDO7519892.1 LysR family transcriptional regulator [Acinetobacter baumannii]MDO7523380.1 LysR family transcriptional regulator [Acinetobacter baumannii]